MNPPFVKLKETDQQIMAQLIKEYGYAAMLGAITDVFMKNDVHNPELAYSLGFAVACAFKMPKSEPVS